MLLVIRASVAKEFAVIIDATAAVKVANFEVLCYFNNFVNSFIMVMFIGYSSHACISLELRLLHNLLHV